MRRVLVAGAGVAALECVLALRELAGSEVAVELLAPAAELVHRPSSVETPFGGAPAARFDLKPLADDIGVHLHRSALASVDTATHHVYTRDGEYVPYDILVVATGARSRGPCPAH
jgi:sulfide:quinone oxidoreductase